VGAAMRWMEAKKLGRGLASRNRKQYRGKRRKEEERKRITK
jgi:hypothetical protein